MAQSIKEAGTLADMIASSINATAEEKQKVLETQPVADRLREVTRIVNKQLEILELGKKIQDQVKEDMDKKQREYYLREQLKAIKTELVKRTRPRRGENTGPKSRTPTCRRRRPRRPSASWSDWRACTLVGGILGGDHLSRLADRPAMAQVHEDTSTSRRPVRSWTTTITVSINPSAASSNTWRCASSSPTPRGQSCASPALRAPAKPRSASPLHAPSPQVLRMSLAGCGTRLKSRPPPHLRRGASGTGHPGHPPGRVQQSGLHAG